MQTKQTRIFIINSAVSLSLVFYFLWGSFYISQFNNIFLRGEQVLSESTEDNSLEQSAVFAEEEIPDETPIDPETYEWQGTPAQPKFITIPSIDTQGFVERVGRNSRNQIAVPSNTNLSGWYTGSALPGEPGLSIIDGHLDGLTAPAIFSKLEDLEVGKTFQVETGDGEILRYRVVDNIKVSEEESVNYLFSQKPNVTSQLNLITCGGVYDSSTQNYLDRIIVMGELI